MKLPLAVKFILIYVSISIVSFVLIATLGSSLLQDRIISIKSQKITTLAKSISDTYKSFDQPFDDEEFYEQIKPISTYEDVRIMCISINGKVFIDTAADYSPSSNMRIANFNGSEAAKNSYMIGDYFGVFKNETFSVTVSLGNDVVRPGYIAIHIPMSDIEDEAEYVLQVIYIVSLAILLMTLLILILLHFFINKPLKKITIGAQKFAEGDLTHHIDIKTGDELEALAFTLNFMADEMNKNGEAQQRFIANVSHDFRSPLTSIKGYIEAMKDGVIPPEMQDKYLGIVLSETKRLTKLTSDLLSVENIKNNMMDMSVFDINKLIQESLLTFEGSSTEKNIEFVLSFSSEETYVYADYSKIQQVIYNLVGNALKFSPNDSTIDLSTFQRKGKISVSVKDHGIGIPSKDIPKIWTRFYKSDASRGKDKTGTGLGLAIVREIITAHSQNISVVSTEGVGSEFTFTLDAASAPTT